MLHVAAVGQLAKQIERFASGLHTDVRWIPLPTQEQASVRFDMVLYLKGDTTAEYELTLMAKQNPIVLSIASTWESVPSSATLDQVLQETLTKVYGFVVGYTACVHKVCRLVRVIAHQAASALDLRTLVVGETGTGKELIAAAIHHLSDRRDEPFVPLNCGAFSKELIDSELFGHSRGSYTGAVTSRAGALKRAGSGVLFLDEVGDLPLNLQIKFLRVLEQRSFSPLGSDDSFPLHAQIISATNQRLDEAVQQGSFRADLYFRIAQMTIVLPPLRERREDIPLLIDYYLHKHDLRLNVEDIIDPNTLKAMLEYDWPGNVRELRSAVERLILLHQGGLPVSAQDWQLFPQPAEGRELSGSVSLASLREDFDREVLVQVLAKHGGDTKSTAEELGISRRSVYNLANRLGIEISGAAKD